MAALAAEGLRAAPPHVTTDGATISVRTVSIKEGS
jgi:hypothetical protein